MKTTTRGASAAVLAVILLLGVGSTPAIAHHSYAMYDTAIQRTVTGKLVRFIIGANHSQFVLQVVNPDGSLALDEKKGGPLIWQVETTSAAQLVRQNITVETFKIGTIFTVNFYPLRDGRNGGAQPQQGPSLIMCGMEMPKGGCNEKTGKKY